MSPNNTEGTPSDEMWENRSQPADEGRGNLFNVPDNFFDPWNTGDPPASPGDAFPLNGYQGQVFPAGSGGGFDHTAPFPQNQPQGSAGNQNTGPVGIHESDRTQQWFINPYGPQPQQNTGQNFNVSQMAAMCPACGSLIYSGQQFCPSCGFVLRQTNGSVPVKPAGAAKKGRTGIIVLSIVCGLLLIVTGIFAFKYFQSGTDETTASPVTETTAQPTTEPTTVPPTTEPPTTAPPTTAPPPTTTQPPTTAANVNGIPAALQQYADKLVYEGRAYRLTLGDADSYLNCRSEPVYINNNVANNNIIGKLRDGTEIYVEYIYDGKWAVFLRDGRYVFSSLFEDNDPSKDWLMSPE